MALYAGRHPYGNIFSVPTTEVDNITKQLYARQALKEQQQRQDNQALDNEFSRNMSGMRDIDIPDLTKAYGDFKNAHIGLQKLGNRATPADQLNVLRSKAAVNEIIQKSKLQREQEKQYGASIMKDGNKYVRDAHGKLIQIMNTPVSQLGDKDPFESLPYKGNMTNMQKLFAAAAGKPIQMDDEVVDNPKELRKDVTKVSRMNNAVEYYNSILGQAVGSQGEDDLVRSVATNISPELYNSTKLQYEQMMSDPITRKRLGMDKTDLPQDEGLTEPQRAAKFLAMTHQLASQPVLKEGTPIYSKVDLSDKRRKEGMEDKKEMAGINDAYIRGRMRQNQAYKMAYKNYTSGVDADSDEKVLNTFIKNTYDNGRKDVKDVTVDGKKYTGRVIDIPKDIKDKYIISKGNTDEAIPDDWYLSDDLKTVIPLFYTGDKTASGNKKISTAKSKPIDIQNFKVDLGKLLLTQKKRGGEVIDQFDVQENTKTKITKHKDPLGLF